MSKTWTTVAMLFCSCALVVHASDVKEKISRLTDTVFATHQFKEVAIAGSGAHVAWVEQWPLDEMRYQNHIFVSAANRANPKRITVADSNDEHGIVWSPDGEKLAFLADQGRRLYVYDLASGEGKPLAQSGTFNVPRWSPDGKTIAVLSTESPSSDQNPVGDWHHRDPSRTVLCLVDPQSGAMRPIGEPGLNVYEYDWSPDGRHIAATGAKGDTNDNWWIAGLYRFDLDGNRTTLLYAPKLQIADPVYAPDGKSIALLGGLMSDFIAPGGDIFVIPATGGEPVNVTPSLPGSATGLTWRKSGEVLFSEDIDGETAVGAADVRARTFQTLWRGTDNISTGGLVSGISIANDGLSSAIIRQSFTQAPEIWTGNIGQWHPLTQVNAKLAAQWGEAKSMHWKNDNFSEQGWLLYPADYQPDRKYPIVVVVHGGPAGDSASKWPKPFYNMEVLAGAGYFVFYPNARGSLGFGETFTQANVKDLGYGDLRDITSGVESLLGKLPIDRNRVGITGWSYGGYMAMWAGTQTQIFHASVAGPGVSNWQSYYGQVDLENWLIPYFGASVYEKPEIYTRSSPINFIRNDKTPTLMYAGAADFVCPLPQAYELYRALEHMQVPTELVIYAGETHGLVIPKYQRAATEAAVGWFEKYLR